MGRSNDYRAAPQCLHIGDLKVPKKYITLTIGSKPLDDIISRSPLQITFESVCTSDVNGEVIKLPSREAHPITRGFHNDSHIVIKVNANKSDRIQIHLDWHDVVVMPFKKRLLFEGSVQESPLPSLVESAYNKNADIRSSADPFLCTHYLTLADHVDYNLQVAVSRAIPVVTTSWLDAVVDSPQLVDQWLLNVDDVYLLSNGSRAYARPVQSRCHLLDGVAVLVLYSGEVLKTAKRLREWVKALGATSVDLESVDIEQREPLSSSASYAIVDALALAICLNNAHYNSTEVLWKAVVEVNRNLLKPLKASTEVPTEASTEPSQSDSARRRIKRRKIERVGDTDFFHFSQPPTLPEKSAEVSLPREEPKEPEDLVREERERKRRGMEAELEKEEEVEKAKAREMDRQMEEEIKRAEETKKEGKKREEAKRDLQEAEFPLSKRAKSEGSGRQWIRPTVSLADAVKSAKEENTSTTRKELGLADTSDVGDQLGKMVIVEDVDLLVRRKSGESDGSNASYAGRKNFKKFRKNGKPIKNVTRTFIELEDHNTDIYFANLPEEPKKSKASRKDQDFSKEMASVRGFQPDPPQLFVQEDSDSDTAINLDIDRPFSFLSDRKQAPEKPAAVSISDSDDDDDVTFAFSRR